MIFTYQRMQNFLGQLCESMGSSAIVATDGRALHVHHENLADIGTLPACAQLAHQYLSLKDGDVVLLNDPFTSGAALSDVTLVTAVSITDLGKPELLLVHRFSMQPRFQVEKSLVEQGLPIPPTPIASHGKLNDGIFAAIQGHPLCPAEFAPLFTRGFEALMNARLKLKRAAPTLGFDFSRNQIRDFLAESHRRMKQALGELPSGEFNMQLKLETGERLKLHLDFTDDKVIFDFAGTDNSPHFHITHNMTFGLCYGSLMAALKRATAAEPLLNAGCFQCVEVRTPAECFLNAKPPASTLLGIKVGAPRVAEVLLRALSSVLPKAQAAENAASPCLVSFDFARLGVFSDAIMGGTGATAQARGEDALSYWAREIRSASLEATEKRAPVLVRTIATRALSGGLGQNRGGHGLIKTFECLKEGTLHWWLENAKVRPEGFKGAKDGALSEIYITRGDERLDLSPFGSTNLKAGDLVTVMSAGGGGFEAVAEQS